MGFGLLVLAMTIRTWQGLLAEDIFHHFPHVFTSLMSKSLAMPHWATLHFAHSLHLFAITVCPQSETWENRTISGATQAESNTLPTEPRRARMPRWWQDMIQMTKAYIKIEEIGSGATWWPSDILKSEDSKGTSSQLLPKAATNATMSSRRQSVLLTAINRGREGWGR